MPLPSMAVELRRSAWSVGGFLQQRLEGGVSQRLRSVRMVEHLLEGRVDALGLADLLDGAAVVACVRRRGLLRTEDERSHCRQVREPVVPLRVPEDRVE